MWRIAGALGLMFGAVAWAALSMVIIFLIVPGLWEAVFGSRGAPFAAIAAFGLMVWISSRMMRLADRLLGEPEYRPPGALAPLPLRTDAGDAPADWRDYTAEIVNQKRWAFYRRTRQFDRLAELEETEKSKT
jgi:hypothetical protein